MKVGRFTVTKLNESVQSDISVKSKISNEKDDEGEVVVQCSKEPEKKNLNENSKLEYESISV